MGFVEVRRDDQGNTVPGWPKVTVRLEHLEPADGPFAKVHWRMLEDLGYELPEDVRYPQRFHVAPAHAAGQSTDLASVPPWLWGVVASFGRHTLAALLHDHLCEEARSAGPPASGRLRRDADRLFRLAMSDLGVPAPRRWLMWAAVRLFGEAGEPGLPAKLPAVVVLAASLAVWAAVVAAIRSGTGGPLVLATLATVLLAAAVAAGRGRRDLAGAMLLGGVAGPLVAPALLVSLATVVVLDAPPLLAWAVRKVASKAPRSRVDDPGPAPKMAQMRSL